MLKDHQYVLPSSKSPRISIPPNSKPWESKSQ